MLSGPTPGRDFWLADDSAPPPVLPAHPAQWVYADPPGDGWHMLVTARARRALDQVPDDDRGVVGAAWSPDLCHGEARPSRSEPGAGFG